ncbi:YebG family protein [Idiomarina sp. UBA4520]|jgi:dsDNA-binding SOS-regulon protein|uniref:YebG family protein n=1 Tax=Idiomarina sp. UBA4520 TaxID=1946647 RepID=UPI000B103C86|nr:YebG family protein [Idiomarina sp. UBA4520]|tara:strand:+ start:9973 stop:10284 length:312 start_codon:yes stop_codon:yes gene_type:complete
MAVVTQYVVIRDGAEKMTFTSKAEADAHDKMLDMAEALTPLIESSELFTDDKQLEDMAMFLAKERENVLIALGAKKPKKPKAEKAQAEKVENKAGNKEATKAA